MQNRILKHIETDLNIQVNETKVDLMPLFRSERGRLRDGVCGGGNGGGCDGGAGGNGDDGGGDSWWGVVVRGW
ncbi:hypothetical protein Hanom_Chr09g00796111 [Helianthus anomalus]